MKWMNGVSLLLVAVVACVTAVPASAAGLGPRIGLSIDPDQVHAGLHIHAAELSRNVAFDPSFDIGAGDDILLFAGNFDFKYVFSSRVDRWRPYLGGGPGLFVVSYDGDESNTDVGVSFDRAVCICSRHRRRSDHYRRVHASGAAHRAGLIRCAQRLFSTILFRVASPASNCLPTMRSMLNSVCMTLAG